MSIVQEVKRAYTERTRQLNFKASKAVPATALSITLKPIGRYNEFSPTRVATAIRSVDPAARVIVAREGSPALYIKTAKSKMIKMTVALKTAKADEINKRPNGWIRAWWD